MERTIGARAGREGHPRYPAAPEVDTVTLRPPAGVAAASNPSPPAVDAGVTILLTGIGPSIATAGSSQATDLLTGQPAVTPQDRP